MFPFLVFLVTSMELLMTIFNSIQIANYSIRDRVHRCSGSVSGYIVNLTLSTQAASEPSLILSSFS